MLCASSRILVSSMALAAALNGCFFGYDSRWGQSKRIQQHNAAAAAPAALEATPPPETSSAAETRSAQGVRAYRVRVYATPAYEAQTLDWHRRVSEIIEDGNLVLGPSVGARLTIESFNDWSVEEQSLSGALHTIRDEDEGRGVDWVIGFVAGLPRATSSFHELGMAEIPGKHLVLRASGVADEKDAIDKAFDELSQADRDKLGRARARHRATAVLLHEIGHTLGAIHVRDPRSLMNPAYDKRMEAFGDPSAALMRAALSHRDDADPRQTATALLSVLDSAPADVWSPADREPLEARLRAVLAASAKAAPAQASSDVQALAPAVHGLAPDVAALPEEARARFVEASRALEAGDLAAALEKARPLFEAQRDVLSVQDLRCKIAMARNTDWDSVRAECARLMELSTSSKR
jgi:Matrixin